MKGESTGKEIRKVRVLRATNERNRVWAERMKAKLENISAASAVAVAIRVHCCVV